MARGGMARRGKSWRVLAWQGFFNSHFQEATKMGYVTLTAKIVGVSPLLMHNAQLANPLNQFAKAMKEITGKRKKTDYDLERLAKLEFIGGMYVNEKGSPAIPGECIEGMLRDGAKKTKQGKDVQCGIISDGIWPLIYDGPKDVEKLWEDERFRDYRGCRVKQSRIMRMRPKFAAWSLVFEIAFQDEVTNKATVIKWLEDAGQFVGLCDFRPKFGRFEVESVK